MSILDLNNEDFGKVPENLFSNKIKKNNTDIYKNTKTDCIFCNISKKNIPASIIFENEYVLAFKDIHPVAPVHIVVIPRIHIDNLNYINKDNVEYVSKIFESIPEIAKKLQIEDKGYRIISNVGENGGQLINHLHFHIVGGKKLGSKIVHE